MMCKSSLLFVRVQFYLSLPAEQKQSTSTPPPIPHGPPKRNGGFHQQDHFTKVVHQDADNVEATMHLGACQQRLGQHHEVGLKLNRVNLLHYGRNLFGVAPPMYRGVMLLTRLRGQVGNLDVVFV